MRSREEIHSDNESKQSLCYTDRMSIVSSIFVLKPIIDLLHTDVLQYADQIRLLKARVEELEKDNAMLRETMTKKIKVETKIESKEEQKAELKDVVIVEQKPEKKTKRKPAIGAIEIKDDDYAKEAETFAPVNVLQDEKTRKDYQKEYQRAYRQQRKEKATK
jgi:hypothetical protein